MNLPNKLTISRVIITPLFVAAMLIEFNGHWLAAFLLFTAASITDMVDGRIARSQGIVTTFGKFLDPLADKIQVVSAYVVFAALGLAHPVAAIIVVMREFLISSVRLLAVSSGGRVISANIWGKVKTSVTMVAMCAVMLGMWLCTGVGIISYEPVALISNILMWVCAALTAVSGAVYLAQNRDVLAQLKDNN